MVEGDPDQGALELGGQGGQDAGLALGQPGLGDARQGLGPVERPLYKLLSVDDARHVDELVEHSGLSSSEVLAALFDLELKGVVRQLPGKQFVKVLL